MTNTKAIRTLTQKEIDHIKKRISKGKEYPSDLSADESEDVNSLIQKIMGKSYSQSKRLCVKAKKSKSRKALLEFILFLEDESFEENEMELIAKQDTIDALYKEIDALKIEKTENDSKLANLTKVVDDKSNECVQLSVENNGLRHYVSRLEDIQSDQSHLTSIANSPQLTAKSTSSNSILITDVDGLHEKLIEQDINYEILASTVSKIEKMLLISSDHDL